MATGHSPPRPSPLVFPRPGRYEFQVVADAAFLGVTFLDAVPFPAPIPQEAA